ncbi:ankyrin repeat protein [Colletotrichum kahawae]|uniref:Ankyrin repeat protein n=1 Tax=Colletotrichum kahawae TaxID=34407 RepID=A0AAD9Y675_COLKA|nr:ankyrin repeat protein [Colletotrichum kahawae]
MPPRRNIRDEDWERLRPIIRELYLEEDRSLKDVLLILGTFHSFYPSKAQLEWKLKQWHLTKNMGVMDWKYVGNEIHRRKCRGKESKVYLSGIPLRTKAVERGISRYCYETAIEKAMHPEPPVPEDQPLLVCTPAAQEMNLPSRLDNIPWLLSRRLIEGNYV